MNTIYRGVFLAIDQSTTTTGYALVRFDENWPAVLLGSGAFDATVAYRSKRRLLQLVIGARRAPESNDTARFMRLRLTRDWLSGVVGSCEHGIDAVCYEEPNMRGAAPTAGIHQAIGAYLTLSAFDGIPHIKIHASTAKAVGGGKAFMAAGQTSVSTKAKQQTVIWAHIRFGLAGDRSDPLIQAQADACAIAVAGWNSMHLPPKQKKARARRPEEREPPSNP